MRKKETLCYNIVKKLKGNREMGKIGLFGGTFDPIHMGHIKLAECVLKEFGLDEIIFIPAGNPPHKSTTGMTDKKHRLKMVKIAIKDNDYFSVSDYEVNNESPNYSYITISHFKEIYADHEIFFIVGGDSFRDFPDWKNYRTLISLCTFIVVSRPGIEDLEYFDKFSGDEKPPRVFFLKDFSCDISSTEIRDKLHKGDKIEGLVPHFVEQYINSNELYL